MPTFAQAGKTYDKWLDAGLGQLLAGGVFAATDEYRIYAISAVQTVVPEPATIVMWSLFAGVAGLVFWRKGRKSS